MRARRPPSSPGRWHPCNSSGCLSSLVLLGAATVLVTRERQRELRLRLLKGQSPWSLGLRVARGAAGAVIAGTLVGGLSAAAAVRLFGPAPEFETAAVRSAIEFAVIGSVVAFVVVAGVATWRSAGFVDSRSRRRSWARLVPWELVPVAAAIVCYARLDRIGGIQQIGARVAHSDFLAQCFPLLAIIAPLAVLARPTIAVLRRWRLAGKRMPPARADRAQAIAGRTRRDGGGDAGHRVGRRFVHPRPTDDRQHLGPALGKGRRLSRQRSGDDDPRRHGAAATVRHNRHHRPPHAGQERHEVRQSARHRPHHLCSGGSLARRRVRSPDRRAGRCGRHRDRWSRARNRGRRHAARHTSSESRATSDGRGSGWYCALVPRLPQRIADGRRRQGRARRRRLLHHVARSGCAIPRPTPRRNSLRPGSSSGARAISQGSSTSPAS